MFLTSSLFENASLKHGFFTRQEGISTGDFASRNCALKTGCLREEVLHNRWLCLKELDLEHAFLPALRQVHGVGIQVINSQPASYTIYEGDALITENPDIVLGICTADCVPILLSSPQRIFVAAVHAGWRGVYAGIVFETIKKIQSLYPQQKILMSCVGPSIHQNFFEVGQEIMDLFKHQDPLYKRFFSIKGKKIFFDLVALVCYQLSLFDIQVDNVSQDTYSNPDLFFSCRRATHEKKAFGGQISLVSLS